MSAGADRHRSAVTSWAHTGVQDRDPLRRGFAGVEVVLLIAATDRRRDRRADGGPGSADTARIRRAAGHEEVAELPGETGARSAACAAEGQAVDREVAGLTLPRRVRKVDGLVVGLSQGPI